ncbi:MAG: hypothetical protein WKG07_08980 [Hymenobacter sp.]
MGATAAAARPRRPPWRLRQPQWPVPRRWAPWPITAAARARRVAAATVASTQAAAAGQARGPRVTAALDKARKAAGARAAATVATRGDGGNRGPGRGGH